MAVIRVALGDRSYDVVIEAGALERAGDWLAPFAKPKPFVVVTDTNVAETQLPRLAASGLALDPIVLPAGEGTKSWDQLAKLCDALLERGVERSDHVLALGGGVIGDLVGFAASILKRGCNFIQLPTSLLAQVDSSVGGKTAINSPAGKNLIGAFHQPSLVLIDPLVLQTLPARELRAGYAEVVKYGLIDDFAFFEWCEANGPALLGGDLGAREKAIAHSVGAKARIVAADERETTGTRALLNLGHTFGHALEAETGFSDRLLHGEAVSIGMVLAFNLSARLGLAPTEDTARAIRHLKAVGLPTTMSGAARDGWTGQRLAAIIAQDKKVRDGRPTLVLARGIGRAFLSRDVPLERIAAFLDDELAAALAADARP